MPASGSPVGSTPFGVGTPESHSAPPEPVSSLVRRIDPLTRDYAIDAASRSFERMPKTRQRVILALTTLRGSTPALPRMGITLPRKLTADMVSVMRASVREALRPLTQEGALSIARIVVEVHPENNSRTIVGVEYVDLLTGAPDSARTVI
jgi:hypothetical protein